MLHYLQTTIPTSQRNSNNMAINTKLFDGFAVFTQVVNDGGFSAAAESTGHSTSYISKEVTKLETRLGVRLLQRTTRSISLTPEGNVFYQQCLQLLGDTEHVISLLTQSHVVPKGVLKISCPTRFGLHYLQPILSEYMHLYPDVSLDLDFSNRYVDVVQDGFDLVIRASTQLEDSSLVCKKLRTYKAYTVASHDYIKKYGMPKHPEELIHHQCICYSNLKAPNKWQYITKNNKTIQVDVPKNLLCNSSEMELAMVKSGHGICRLPEFYMEEELKNNELCILFSDYETQKIEVHVLYPSRKHLLPKVRCLIELLAEKIPFSPCPD